jgi:hypothetical protein
MASEQLRMYMCYGCCMFPKFQRKSDMSHDDTEQIVV